MPNPPITVAEFLAAVGPTFALPENARMRRAKPRASGIANCARQQWYYMNDTEPTAERNSDQDLTAEQGRMFEGITLAIMRTKGLTVASRQDGIPDDYPVSGHPDGDDLVSTSSDKRWRGGPGKKWGFEHKHYGRYEYERMLKLGVEQGNPEALSQILMYGDALGWDYCWMVVVSQDASAVRGDMSINKRAKNESSVWVTPDMNPKVQFFVIDINEYKGTLIPMLKMRARWLSEHVDDPTPPRAEFVPFATGKQDKIEFPCSHCPYLRDCQEAGQDGPRAPGLPFIKEVEWPTTSSVTPADEPTNSTIPPTAGATTAELGLLLSLNESE